MSVMATNDKEDILEQRYRGPNREVAGVGVGAVEAKVALIPGTLIGGFLGHLNKEAVEAYLEKHPYVDQWVVSHQNLVDWGLKKFAPKLTVNNATVAGAVAGTFILPTLAGFHGMYLGYRQADNGKQQFKDAQNEIRDLRTQVVALKAENTTWQKRIETERAEQEAKQPATEVGA